MSTDESSKILRTESNCLQGPAFLFGKIQVSPLNPESPSSQQPFSNQKGTFSILKISQSKHAQIPQMFIQVIKETATKNPNSIP